MLARGKLSHQSNKPYYYAAQDCVTGGESKRFRPYTLGKIANVPAAVDLQLSSYSGHRKRQMIPDVDIAGK